jgi:hypothetical protein
MTQMIARMAGIIPERLTKKKAAAAAFHYCL